PACARRRNVHSIVPLQSSSRSPEIASENVQAVDAGDFGRCHAPARGRRGRSAPTPPKKCQLLPTYLVVGISSHCRRAEGARVILHCLSKPRAYPLAHAVNRSRKKCRQGTSPTRRSPS